VKRMKKTELRSTPELGLSRKAPQEKSPRAASARLARGRRDPGGVYFIEPRHTKMRSDGRA
jgi:hypothetical protein